MGATIDHLAADQRVKILKNFTDAEGQSFAAGEIGRIRKIDLDWKTMVATIHLEQGKTLRRIVLADPCKVIEGHRSGRMRDYFQVEAERVYGEEEAPPPGRMIFRKPSRPQGPAWFQKALDYEFEDRLEEAEKLIEDAVPNLYCAITMADMYRYRWERLAYEGKREAAIEARNKSAHFAWYMASLATSGGEGAALSRERDAFLATLGPDPEESK